MKNKLNLKLTLSSVITILTASILSTSVCAWGPATHTYFGKKLGNKYGVMNWQEMYGALLPDMFNFMFGYPHQRYLWRQTHYEFMKVVEKAKFGRRKAFAYGFVSHNEEWGADQTAHISAITNPGEGYVVTKKKILAPLLEPKIEAFLTANSIPHTPELVEKLALAVADSSIEFAVDLLVSQNEDKRIGIEMLRAAKLRSPFVPILLSRAYAEDFAEEAGITLLEAIGIIMTVEKEFKEYMELYGGILREENAADLMAEEAAQLAEAMLEKEYGIEVDVPPELTKDFLLAAVEVIKDDYSEELEGTLEYIEEQLEAHEIETYSRKTALNLGVLVGWYSPNFGEVNDYLDDVNDDWDTDLEFEGGMMYGAAVEYEFTPNFKLRGEWNAFKAETSDRVDYFSEWYEAEYKLNVSSYTLSGIYTISPEKPLSPYIGAGVGQFITRFQWSETASLEGSPLLASSGSETERPFGFQVLIGIEFGTGILLLRGEARYISAQVKMEDFESYDDLVSGTTIDLGGLFLNVGAIIRF